MQHNLLVEPLLSWRGTDRRRHRATLPGILARLSDGSLVDFCRVRAHQFHPWSMFLTQLAAIALCRAGQSTAVSTEDDWRELLLALTGGAHEPWTLVVPNLASPAFFQPPVPEGEVNSWRVKAHPDDLDVLVTAKNHDVKMQTVAHGDIESWIYYLVTLQTTQGYPGRGYRPVVRMNGGYGNRARIGLAPGETPSGRFLRDVAVLLDQWPIQVQERGYRHHGVALCWTEPWDGNTSLNAADLAPHFIEVCWRVRLGPINQGLQCRFTTTTSRRCLPEVDTGDVGDVWVPVERTAGKVLTVGSNGFDYRLISRLLMATDFEPAPAQLPRPDDAGAMRLVASALTRGQGKTDGLHERVLLLGRQAWSFLFREDSRQELGRRASNQVTRAGLMRTKVLYPALRRLAGSGPIVRDSFDERVDEKFFVVLFANLDLAQADGLAAFDRELVGLAHDEFHWAIKRSSGDLTGRLRDVTEAEALFRSLLQVHFSDALDSPVFDGGPQ